MTPIIQSYNEDTIRALAHQRWIDEGKPDGRAEIHWEWALAALTASAERPVPKKMASDDISLIGGIGPKIAKQLIAEGISTFAQIAALTEKSLNALDEKLALKGRALREEWVKQARELLAGQAPRTKVDQNKAGKAK